MHSKSDYKEILINDEANEVIAECFESLLNRNQNNLQKLIKSSKFVFNYVHLLYCKWHKTNPNSGKLYKNSLDWIKIKKQMINPINKKDNKCYQRALTFALNHGEIKKDLQRTIKIKPFINKYN